MHNASREYDINQTDIRRDGFKYPFFSVNVGWGTTQKKDIRERKEAMSNEVVSDINHCPPVIFSSTLCDL